MATKRMRLENPDVTRTTDYMKWPLGTRFAASSHGPFLYACAGEDLKAFYPAFSHSAVTPESYMEMSEREYALLMWGALKATGEKALMMGWPHADIKKGHYFWLREK